MKKRKIRIRFINNAKIKIILMKIVYITISIFILYNIIYLINTTITKKHYLSIWGISIFSMENNAMKPDIAKNNLIITKACKESEIKENDIIAYQINNSIRINKIINIKSDNGKVTYITKSSSNYYPDIEEVFKNQIIGKVTFNIWGIGLLINILQSKIITFFALIVLILRFSYNRYVYQQNKQRKRKKRLKEEI